MTIKELIEKLREFPEDLVVVYAGEETEEPNPKIMMHEFDTSYWNGELKIVKLPRNKEYVEL